MDQWVLGQLNKGDRPPLPLLPLLYRPLLMVLLLFYQLGLVQMLLVV